MFVIEWTYKWFANNKVSFLNREEALECWASLKVMPGIVSLRGYKKDKIA